MEASSSHESVDEGRQSNLPSVDEIRSRALSLLGKRPCLWQIRICRALLEGSRDVISIAGTGMGKTLTFWLPLLFRPYGIQIVVTPLNILGQQNVDTLAKVGVHGIFISARTASKKNFDVRNPVYRSNVIYSHS
jgi:superfamily II DNA helicase RecQ